MKRAALLLGAFLLVVGLAAHDAHGFGHRYRGCGGWGCGGYGSCGYGGWAYGGWSGWGNAGWGYGGWGYGAYRPSLRYVARSTPPATNVSAAATSANDATLSVSVPADARVVINDHVTKSTGQRRVYVSRNLLPDARYTYRVRVEFTRDGQPVVEQQTVQLTGGQNQSLAFGGGQRAPTTSATAALR